jgi:hypothetical protein
MKKETIVSVLFHHGRKALPKRNPGHGMFGPANFKCGPVISCLRRRPRSSPRMPGNERPAQLAFAQGNVFLAGGSSLRRIELLKAGEQ